MEDLGAVKDRGALLGYGAEQRREVELLVVVVQQEVPAAIVARGRHLGAGQQRACAAGVVRQPAARAQGSARERVCRRGTEAWRPPVPQQAQHAAERCAQQRCHRELSYS